MNPNNMPRPEWDRILTASMRNDSQLIRYLIEQEGVGPSHANAVAQSALHIASLWGNVESVKVLLQHNANVNAQNSMTGATPMHCAVQSMKGTLERRIECIDLLLAKGADPALADFFGKTPSEYCDDNANLLQRLQPQQPPLFQAISNGNLEELQQLLSANQQEETNNNNSPHNQLYMGQTPFLFALDLLLSEEDENDNNDNKITKSKLVEILKILLETGANVNAASAGTNANDPMQALEGPAAPPLFRICEALQMAYKNAASNNKDDIQALEDACQLFLKHKATVPTELEQLLHTACRKNEVRLAKFLITVIGIDPNIPGRQGMTPLQFAARSGKVEMVQFLLQQSSIDLTRKDDRGQTALDAARVNDKQEIVTLLEEFAKK